MLLFNLSPCRKSALNLGHQSSSLEPPPAPLDGPVKSTLRDFRRPCTKLKGEFDFAFASLPSWCPQEALSYSSFSEQSGAASVSPGETRSGRDPEIFRWSLPLPRRTLPHTILSCFCLGRPNWGWCICSQRSRIFPVRNSLHEECPVWTASRGPLIVWEAPTKGAIKVLGCAHHFLSVILNSSYIVP